MVYLRLELQQTTVWFPLSGKCLWRCPPKECEYGILWFKGKRHRKSILLHSFLNFKVKFNELKGGKKRNVTFVNRYFICIIIIWLYPTILKAIFWRKTSSNSHKTFFKRRNDTWLITEARLSLTRLPYLYPNFSISWFILPH